VPLEHVVCCCAHDVEVAGGARGGAAVAVGEQHGARQVRVVGCVAGGPIEGAAADDGAQAGWVAAADRGPGGEFEGGAEGVAGVEAEEGAGCAGEAGRCQDGGGGGWGCLGGGGHFGRRCGG